MRPEIAPAAVTLTVGEVMKLSKPVPKVIPLKILLTFAVMLPKFKPVIVLAPDALSVPERFTSMPSTEVVPLDAVF